MTSSWYQSFFTPLAMDFWNAAVPPEVTAKEVDFLERHLGVAAPARLLDLPCGSGRHALGLAGRGHLVTGVDLSPNAVADANAKALSTGVSASFHLGDMVNAVPDGPFDAAYCFGNSFAYLEHEDLKHFIRNVLEAIRPGGRWIIDTGTAAESIFPHLKEEVRRLEAGGVTFVTFNHYDAKTGRLLSESELSRGTEVQTGQVSYAVYTTAELLRLLEAEGWRVVDAYGDLDGRPFRLGDRRLLLIAARP